MSNWQLPEGIDELTGDQAVAFEASRRGLLDLYQGIAGTAFIGRCRQMLVLRESWGPSPHFYRQMPVLLVLLAPNDWSISAAPAAARTALRAKLQRMALSLRTMHRARLKAIGVRGGVQSLTCVLFLVCFGLFIFGPCGGGKNEPGRVLKGWCRDCWYCFYRQMLVLWGSWGPSPHFYRQMPGLLVLPTSNDWSISAAPAAARAALRAKLQRTALSLRTIHRACFKAIGVRGGG